MSTTAKTQVVAGAAPARASRAKTAAPAPVVPAVEVASAPAPKRSKKSPRAASPVAAVETVVSAPVTKASVKAAAAAVTSAAVTTSPSGTKQKAVKAAAKLVNSDAAAPAKPARVAKAAAQPSDGVTPPVPAKASRPKRVSASPLMSPRTASSRLADKGDALSYRDVRMTADAVSRNVARLAQIVAMVEKKGTYELNGRTYTRADVREMTRALTQAVKRIPVACRLSSRRGVAALPDEEREGRIRSLLDRAYAGIDELTSIIGMPALNKVMRANEKARIEAIRVPSKPDAGLQISAAFYISDPLREFIRNANLGNGIALFFPEVSDEVRAVSGAENPDAALAAVQEELGAQRNVLKELGVTKEQARLVADPRYVIKSLIIERGIATSPLLMSIMACYIAANGLKGPDGRISLDDNMRKHFGSGSTRWVFGGKDLTPAEALDDVNLSGLERLKRRAPKNSGDPVPFDGKTFARSMSIALASMYRIAKVPDDLAAALTNPRVVNLASGVKSYL